MKRLETSGRAGMAQTISDLDESLHRLHREGTAARLTDSATINLEALVSLTDRPALPVETRQSPRGQVQTINVDDPALGGFSGLVIIAQGDLEQRFGSVGRIDSGGTHIGTGFVVGKKSGLVVTNRHVLESLASPVPRVVNPQRGSSTRRRRSTSRRMPTMRSSASPSRRCCLPARSRSCAGRSTTTSWIWRCFAWRPRAPPARRCRRRSRSPPARQRGVP
ncbi:hypothetical protein AJ88_15610 [Mesorhizobium amorphae CCBAU 01583]|nr:hypothetical protein AJ88_15610 [Mesorhizobium amorphae CCBAU 01583]